MSISTKSRSFRRPGPRVPYLSWTLMKKTFLGTFLGIFLGIRILYFLSQVEDFPRVLRIKITIIKRTITKTCRIMKALALIQISRLPWPRIFLTRRPSTLTKFNGDQENCSKRPMALKDQYQVWPWPSRTLTASYTIYFLGFFRTLCFSFWFLLNLVLNSIIRCSPSGLWTSPT